MTGLESVCQLCGVSKKLNSTKFIDCSDKIAVASSIYIEGTRTKERKNKNPCSNFVSKTPKFCFLFKL